MMMKSSISNTSGKSKIFDMAQITLIVASRIEKKKAWSVFLFVSMTTTYGNLPFLSRRNKTTMDFENEVQHYLIIIDFYFQKYAFPKPINIYICFYLITWETNPPKCLPLPIEILRVTIILFLLPPLMIGHWHPSMMSKTSVQNSLNQLYSHKFQELMGW